MNSPWDTQGYYSDKTLTSLRSCSRTILFQSILAQQAIEVKGSSRVLVLEDFKSVVPSTYPFLLSATTGQACSEYYEKAEKKGVNCYALFLIDVKQRV